MILQALNDYYLRCQRSQDLQERLPEIGFEEKEISFVIEIDEIGNLVNLIDTRILDGNKKIGQAFLVPQGAKKASGISANLFWENAEYIFGIPDLKKRESKRKDGENKEADYLARLVEMKVMFRKRIETLLTEAPHDVGIQAVFAFLNNVDFKQLESLSAWVDISSINPTMTFRLHGSVELICQRPAVVSAVLKSIDDAKPDGICLVNGNYEAIERLHPAIKGVWGAQIAGANIVSFNLDAFNSYGKTQGSNAPISKSAVFGYTTALNHLLARHSRQRIQIGDTSTVIWSEQKHDLENVLLDLFGNPQKDDPSHGTDTLKALLRAIHSGKFVQGTTETRFHILGLAPNAARIAIRFWTTATAHDLGKRIFQHFEDIKIAHAQYEQEHLSLFRLLIGIAVQAKAENIPPNLGGQIMRAILEDLPYPMTLLNLAVQRSRTEHEPSYARVAVIKASLNRLIRRTDNYSEKEFEPMLDLTNLNQAYRLGRLFATLEKIQEEANLGINATIRDRYYGAASSTPVTVFTTLLRLKNHHMGKLNKGRAVQMERLIGEIMCDLNDFPRILTLQDQGRFALGYYHQRQAFFTKSDNTNNQEESK